MANTTKQCPAHRAESSVTTVEDREKPIDHSKLLPIPSPPYKHYFGLLGHLTDLDPVLPVRSYWKLMDEYAPIFQMDLGMTYPRVFVGSRELVNEMADDSCFTKFTHRLHQEMRPVFGNGLFSAESTDKAWGKAHRLLIPALGPIGLSGMFDDMQDIATQLVLKWDRFGPDREIEVIDDMSRLTFDTIGLCAYGYRFNQFYNEEPHPFQKQLKESIVESGKRANRPNLLNRFYYYKDEEHRQDNIQKLQDLSRKIIQERIDNPKPEAKDLLNVMIHGVDHETGETLGFENVMYQIFTLLGAGFETTTSTLCFILYFLTTHPITLIKAQQEVDDVVGDGVLVHDMLRRLPYVDACVKETLRLQHPVSLLTRFSTKETVLGGKYFIKKGQMVSGIWRHFHRDPAVWGHDADEFRPERMLDVNFQKLPPNSWKPFGDGLRACIGRGFAEQEIMICLTMILQRFLIEKANPSYKLELTGQMGVKPIDFKIRARRRENRPWTIGIPGGNNSAKISETHKSTRQSKRPQQNEIKISPGIQTTASIIWGGNQGTCENLAQSLIATGSDFGINFVEVMDLDSAVDKLPTDRPCIIISPSYEGRPPYNGKKFVQWIERMATERKALPNIKFAVFGVGNSDWVHTFHRIPKLIEEKLLQLGAERIQESGFANVKRDTIGPWEIWSEKLCMSLAGTNAPEVPDRVGVEVLIERNNSTSSAPSPETLSLDRGLVLVNRELADTSIGPAKRHIEIQLPQEVQYSAGDHLLIHGRNTTEIVARILKRFQLNAGDMMTVKGSGKTHLPALPIAIDHFLSTRVELAMPITKKQIGVLTSWSEEDKTDFLRLRGMCDDAAYQGLLDKRYSIIDVLEEVPNLRLPFGVYIDLLPAQTPRAYSISSSPLDRTSRSKDGAVVASITYDVFEATALSGHGTFGGVASSHLSRMTVGDTISCCVRPNKIPFQLPPDPSIPIILLAAGSGIAPVRAFLQERASIKQIGKQTLGPALLFFGCRHPEKDYIYRSEIENWEKQGIVESLICFSRPTSGEEARYVPDALWEQRGRVWDLFEDGAKVFICGSAGKLGRAVAETWRKIWMENTGENELAAFEWFESIKNLQYVSDVY